MKKPVAKKRRGYAEGGRVSTDVKDADFRDAHAAFNRSMDAKAPMNSTQDRANMQSADIALDRMKRVTGTGKPVYPKNQPEGYPAPVGFRKGGKVKQVIGKRR